MKYDIILAGVGGQGVLSLAAIIALGAMRAGLNVKQSEVHGMAQRGGAVQAHLRIADAAIESDLIGKGTADMILSMEPLESLRYLDFLKTGGVIISSTNPMINIPDYPQTAELTAKLEKLPRAKMLDAKAVAKEAGSPKATNMVMVGAAAAYIPLEPRNLEAAIADIFARKGGEIVEINQKAFRLGRQA